MDDERIEIDRAPRSHWLTVIFDRSVEVLGAAAGAGIAGGDPFWSATASGAIVQTLKSVGAEIQQRVIAPREQFRLTRSADLIVQRIKAKYDEGAIPRDDAFFEPGENGRTAAEEILEGTLLAVQRDAEERKLSLYANLLTNIAFENRISREYANALISIVQRLTHRQLVLIAFFGGDPSGYGLVGTPLGERPSVRRPIEFFGLLHEMVNLFQSGLLVDTEHLIMGREDINPSHTKLSAIGQSLYYNTDMAAESTQMVQEFEKIALHLR